MADDHLFQKLCMQAAVACKGDIEAIERFVREHLESLTDQQRDDVTRDLERIFAFRAPDRSTKPH